nr:spore coat U domain-containing protein [Acidithiobacillus concretivorus]
MKYITQLIVSLSVLLLFAPVNSAEASVKTATFNVEATVAPICKVSAQNLNFGSYTPGTSLDGQSEISGACTNGTQFTVSWSPGLHAGSAGYDNRNMAGTGSGPATSADLLHYQLYSTANHNAVLGDGSDGTITVSSAGIGMNTVLSANMYGQIPDTTANQQAVPGTYSDTITVTVTY